MAKLVADLAGLDRYPYLVTLRPAQCVVRLLKTFRLASCDALGAVMAADVWGKMFLSVISTAACNSVSYRDCEE